MKIHEHDAGHMTKMAQHAIYGKNSSKTFFSGTDWPISTKLGMQLLGLQHIIVCSNDEPGLTLTFFYGKTNFHNLGFSVANIENSGFFRKYWSMWPDSILS